MFIEIEKFEVESGGKYTAFHSVTEEVQALIDKHNMKKGLCVVYSHHTTCSVMTQESSFDECYTGLEFLQQDLCDVFEDLVPTCRKEGQYMHPGPKLTEFAAKYGESKPETLNTDAHLRSVFLGRSESIIVVDGKLDLGQFGNIYFIDFDLTRPRKRQVMVELIGE